MEACREQACMETEGVTLRMEMEAYAKAHHVPILNEHGRRFYAEFVRKQQPHRILELGTAIGYSALLALSLAPADCTVETVELLPARYEKAKHFLACSPLGRRVTQHLGDAGEMLDVLRGQGKTYDFIFLDAAKGQYPDYFEKAAPMLEEGGVIVADNVLFRGYVLHPVMMPRRFETIVERLQRYLELVNTPPYTTEIFPRGDGLALTRRESASLSEGGGPRSGGGSPLHGKTTSTLFSSAGANKIQKVK
ncbi:O-methyltransferase [uncultured Selenomonas sp.]|uniref:O-methyltransferase n=1 Tax=uncultured Selenomonas sp. TaxID=159275 RepID=UPI0025D710F4|nr:O-methyltransferase [uncultured Selenomonas sp.]